MKANKKKRLSVENNKKYKDENKESIDMKKRINKSFKKIKKKDVDKQIKYKKENGNNMLKKQKE